MPATKRKIKIDGIDERVHRGMSVSALKKKITDASSCTERLPNIDLMVIYLKLCLDREIESECESNDLLTLLNTINEDEPITWTR